MDRILAVIIIFLGISVLMAAVLAMGAVPKIFQNAEVINETQDETRNQTEIIIKQFQRENNTTQKILSNQNRSLLNQYHMLEGLNATVQIIGDILTQLNITRIEHDRIVIESQNTTNNVAEDLEMYGENSLEKFNMILENQEKLLKLLKNGTNR